MQKTVVSFGELLWDLLPSGPVLGGAPANFAYRVNSLGNRSLIVSRLGKDHLGQAAAAKLADLGMDTRFIQWDPQYPTGTVLVQLDAQGTPDFFIVPEVAYDHIQCEDALLAIAREADCLCFGTLAQRAPESRATIRRLLEAAPETMRFLDINLRKDCFSDETITSSLAQADILKLNESEAQYLSSRLEIPAASLVKFSQEVARRWDLSLCVVTLGDRGALLVPADGDCVYSPGYKVKVADTCGSGDAFSAGFLHAHLRGESLPECARLGNALGALVSTQHGATEPISAAVLASFLQREPERIIDPALQHL